MFPIIKIHCLPPYNYLSTKDIRKRKLLVCNLLVPLYFYKKYIDYRKVKIQSKKYKENKKIFYFSEALRLIAYYTVGVLHELF